MVGSHDQHSCSFACEANSSLSSWYSLRHTVCMTVIVRHTVCKFFIIFVASHSNRRTIIFWATIKLFFVKKIVNTIKIKNLSRLLLKIIIPTLNLNILKVCNNEGLLTPIFRIYIQSPENVRFSIVFFLMYKSRKCTFAHCDHIFLKVKRVITGSLYFVSGIICWMKFNAIIRDVSWLF